MAFLEILLALAIERLWLSVVAWRRFTWFTHFTAWSKMRVIGVNVDDIHEGTRAVGGGTPGTVGSVNKNSDRRSRVSVLLATLAPALGVGLIHYLFSELLLILAVIFDVAVLIYCLGPKDLDTQVRAFMHACTHADKDAAQHYMADITGVDITPPASLTTPQMIRCVIEAILIQANERWFAVIFWFFVLGPMGAIFYRLSSLLKYSTDTLHREERHPAGCRETSLSPDTLDQPDNFAAAAHRLHAILGWLPARCTALSYAIMGSFVDAIDGWSQDISDQFMNHSSSNTSVVIASGLGALRMHDTEHGVKKKILGVSHVRNALALVWRTVIFCLVVILVVSLTSSLI